MDCHFQPDAILDIQDKCLTHEIFFTPALILPAGSLLFLEHFTHKCDARHCKWLYILGLGTRSVIFTPPTWENLCDFNLLGPALKLEGPVWYIKGILCSAVPLRPLLASKSGLFKYAHSACPSEKKVLEFGWFNYNNMDVTSKACGMGDWNAYSP